MTKQSKLERLKKDEAEMINELEAVREKVRRRLQKRRK